MSDGPHTPSILLRILKMVGTFVSTTMTAALAIGLVVFGSSIIADRAESVGLPDVAPAVAVTTQSLRLEPGYTVTRSFVGQLEAAQQTDLAFEAGGTLADILVDEGMQVAEGQVVARTDIRALQAERAAIVAEKAALDAQLELAKLTTKRQEALEKQGFSATQRFDEARLAVVELQARLDAADAQLSRIDVALDKSTLRAPFAGRIGARMADQGQTLGAGQPLLSILEDRAPRIRVGLPADMVGDLQEGSQVFALFGAEEYAATLINLRPDLDPRTRTRTAVFELAIGANQAAPAFGQSGQISLTQTVQDQGAWVPLMALREGVNGSWTVLTIAEDNLAAVEAVELLHTDETRAFVRGSFVDGTSLIAAGPHRVVPGQSVEIAE